MRIASALIAAALLSSVLPVQAQRSTILSSTSEVPTPRLAKPRATLPCGLTILAKMSSKR